MSMRSRMIDNRMCQRMLAALVQAGGKAQDFGWHELPGTDHSGIWDYSDFHLQPESSVFWL